LGIDHGGNTLPEQRVAVDAQDPDAIGVRHISLLPSREPLSSVVRFATPTGTATRTSVPVSSVPSKDVWPLGDLNRLAGGRDVAPGGRGQREEDPEHC